MWLTYAATAVVCITLFNTGIKLSGARIDALMGTTLIMAAGLAVLLTALIVQGRWQEIGTFYTADKAALLWTVFAGIAIGLGNLMIVQAYANGAPLSIGNMVINVGSILGVFMVGVVLLREPLDMVRVAGILLALIGIWLVLK